MYHSIFYVVAIFSSVLYYNFVQNMYASLLVFPSYIGLFSVFIGIHRNLIGIAKDSDNDDEVNVPLFQLGSKIWRVHIAALICALVGVFSADRIYVESHQTAFRDELGSTVLDWENRLHEKGIDELKSMCRESVILTRNVWRLNYRNALWSRLLSEHQKKNLTDSCTIKDYVLTNCKGKNIMVDENRYSEESDAPCNTIYAVTQPETPHAPTTP